MLVFNKRKINILKKISGVFLLFIFILYFSFSFFIPNTSFAQNIFNNQDLTVDEVDTSKNPTKKTTGGVKTIVPIDTNQQPGFIAPDKKMCKNGSIIPKTSYCLEDYINLTPGQETSSKKTDTTYKFLAPLSDKLTVFESAKDCALGEYLNILIKILIGFSAVLAMVMITIGGIEYMTSELVSSKKAGIERITNAILGLVLALSAFLILNTINPKLLNVCLDKLPEARVTIIENFEISGGASFDGKPIKINFNTEAYPAAKIASQKTGVDTAFILAIFGQETSSGRNTGSCNYKTANMKPGELEALKIVATSLGKDYTKINMSCSGGASTYGGAIGLTQFLPGTWLQYKNEAAKLLGHQPNPWNTADALMMTALKLKNDGGINNQKEAACKYFAGSGNNCGTNTGINNYGNEVMGKKLSIQQQITNGINNKTLSP